ncbi:MAG: hypothetical protein WED08_00050 [Patescibacteria group bacterium]
MSEESLGALAYLFAYGTLVVSFIPAVIGLYLYKLDRISGLTMVQAIVVLIVTRLIDGGTFLWAAGGEVLPEEMNLVYRFLAEFLPHLWAFLLSFSLIGIAAFLLALPVVGWILRRWGTPAEVRRFQLTMIATYSALSLVGVVTNVSFALLGWQSPFLFP